MKTRILIFAFTFAILFFLVACTKDDCLKFKEQADIDNCFVEKAISENNVELCNKAKQQNFVDMCNAEIAVQNQNFGLCNDILDSERKEYCIAQTSVSLLKDENCGVLSNEYWQNICYKSIAVNTSN